MKKKVFLNQKSTFKSIFLPYSKKFLLLVGIIVIGLILALWAQKSEETKPNIQPFSGKKIVPIMPYTAYLHSGESINFTYWRQNITIFYQSSIPKHVIKLIVNGEEFIFTRERNAEGPIYHGVKIGRVAGLPLKGEAEIRFVIEPVRWVKEYGEVVPEYGGKWNTSEIYFYAFVRGVG